MFIQSILCPENLRRAWRRVKANGGAAGVDGMTLAQFPAFARQYWQEIRSRLLAGTYHPAPVRRVFERRIQAITRRSRGVSTYGMLSELRCYEVGWLKLAERGVPNLRQQWIGMHYGQPNQPFHPAAVNLTGTAWCGPAC